MTKGGINNMQYTIDAIENLDALEKLERNKMSKLERAFKRLDKKYPDGPILKTIGGFKKNDNRSKKS